MRVLLGLLLVVAPSFAQSDTPFSLIQVSRQFDETGALKSETRFLFAVNRNGSIVCVDLDPASGATRQILDRIHGNQILINPKARWASIMAYRVPRQSPEACERRFVSGFRDARVSVEKLAGSIQGVEVEPVSVDSPNWGGDVYMAPSLGCQMLRTVSRLDSRVLETSVAENLRIGDPDAALFRIPDGYRVTDVFVKGGTARARPLSK